MRIRQSIALVGLSGSGKSTVARLLAERLGWRLCDTDAMIVAGAGRSAAQIFAEEGEASFRALEAAALRQALEHVPCVVATGGGIVLRADNRALLRTHACVVWLDAPTGELIARLRAHDEERPLLAGDAVARLEALRTARGSLYREVADLRVETSGRDAEAICDIITEELQ
jgi:shikimate kinase